MLEKDRDGALPLSVAIITLNEAANLPRTLDSVRALAREIVVVDSGSQDETCAIAASYGARVEFRAWTGHIDQKNHALGLCSQEWVLALDADEELTPECAASIRLAVTADQGGAWRINRRTYYLGKLLQYSWQPDRKLRLVRRDLGARWSGYDPHDKLVVENTHVGDLSGDVIHYSYRDLQDHMERSVRYAKISATSYARMGRRFSFVRLLINPLFAFVKKYVLRRGFLDGWRGLLVACSAAWSVALKYWFLRELEQRDTPND